MRILRFLILALLVSTKISAIELPRNISTGDLIFIDLDCGEFCQAVTDVTQMQFGRGPKLNHMGMFLVSGAKQVFVYEALPQVGVVKTSYVDLVKRLQSQSRRRVSDRMVIGRIKPAFKSAFIRAAGYISAEVGKPYNPTFSYHSKGFYCSQLIQKVVTQGAQGIEIFSWRPMFFGKNGSPARKIWENYFQKIGSKVPDGELGVSPLGMYLDGKGRVFD